MSDDCLPGEQSDLPARVLELEERLTFHQAAFDQLNGVVLKQQAELEKLREEVRMLRQLSQTIVDRGVGEDLPHDKPPHY